MTTLLYHSKSVGYVCKRIANKSNNNIQAICDRDLELLDGRLIPVISGRVIHWDSRIHILADEVINNYQQVKLSRNKKESRKVLGDLTLNTWYRLKDIKYPCVIRPGRHHGGMLFFVCNTAREALVAIGHCRNWYASTLIQKTKEYRVFVFNGKVIKVTRRYAPEDGGIAWNPSLGGSITRVLKESWPSEVINIAIKAGEVLQLGWYAADVAVDTNRPYVLECNTAPGIHREQTIIKFAEIFSA